MERITERLKDVLADTIDCISEVQQDVIDSALAKLSAYEGTGLEPWEIGPAIETAAKDAESATAAKMAECIAGGIKDTVDAIHRDPDGFFKGGAR